MYLVFQSFVYCAQLFCNSVLLWTASLLIKDFRHAKELSCIYCPQISHCLWSAWGDNSPRIRTELVEIRSPVWIWDKAIQRVDQWNLSGWCQGSMVFLWDFSSMSATWVLCQMDKKTNSRGALQLSLTPRFISLKPYNLGQIPFPLWIPIFRCKRETQIFYEWFKDLMKHFSTLPGTWWDKRNGSCVIAVLFVTEERSRGLLRNSYILKRERKIS